MCRKVRRHLHSAVVLGTNKIIQYNYGVNFTLVPISEISF